MTTDLILGTAGHIDHGKTALIGRLTGTNTDRLPEEKRRGITIELGFAELDLGEYQFGVVDVPGHERFVRQMLCGATGIDVAMLVVAADDSVKPQTREHLDVLRLLSIPVGVIALTKVDAADPDWINLVEEEIRELVSGTFLEGAPIVRTSAVTGEGIESLREALVEAARKAAPQVASRTAAPFRMAIDRSFTLPGHGTVVTGSVSSGSVSVGDELVIEPGRLEVRVRGLHHHDRDVSQVQRGQRAAINLSGVHHDQLGRGHELAAPGYLVPSQLITTRMEVLPSLRRGVKRRDVVRFHVGTAEVLATVQPLGVDELAPGDTRFVQFFLSEPVVTTWSQPFVIRRESPVVTLGGGSVVIPVSEKLTRATSDQLGRLDDLLADDLETRAAAAIYFANTQFNDPHDLFRIAGIPEPLETYESLRSQRIVRQIRVTGHRQRIMHRDRLDEYADRITTLLGHWHDREPLKSMFERSRLVHEFGYLGDAAIVNDLLELMHRKKQIRLNERAVGLTDRAPKLSKGEADLLQKLVARMRDAGMQPPTLKECEADAEKNRKSVRSLIALACSDGELVEIGENLVLHADVEAEVRAKLSEAFAASGTLTVSEIRETLGSSRKYVVPLCEYLDRIGFTERDGDRRRLRASTSEPVGTKSDDDESIAAHIGNSE